MTLATLISRSARAGLLLESVAWWRARYVFGCAASHAVVKALITPACSAKERDGGVVREADERGLPVRRGMLSPPRRGRQDSMSETGSLMGGARGDV